MGAIARERLPEWRKSRRCDTAACVEAASVEGGMWMRDGDDPAGPVLAFSGAAWRAFLADVRESKSTKSR